MSIAHEMKQVPEDDPNLELLVSHFNSEPLYFNKEVWKRAGAVDLKEWI